MPENFKIKFLFILSLIFLLVSCSSKNEEIQEDIAINILPRPNKILKRSGVVKLDKDIWLIANVSDTITATLATYLVDKLHSMEGVSAYITDLYSTRPHQQSIKIQLDEALAINGEEYYELKITSPKIELSSGSPIGLFRGITSLLQLLEYDPINDEKVFTLKKMVIKDQPWAGRRAALSEQSLEEIELNDLLEKMVTLKMNQLVLPDTNSISLDNLSFAKSHFIEISQASTIESDATTLIITETDLEDVQSVTKIKPGKGTENIQFRIDSLGSIKSFRTLILAAQMGWSNEETVDSAWLEQQLTLRLSPK